MSMRLAMKASLESVDMDDKAKQKALRKAKKNCKVLEKPEPVKTHLRNMIIVPEMIGSVCGVYNGKHYTTVEIKVC